MTKETMSVTQALVELKTLDARITKKIGASKYITVYSKQSPESVEDMSKAIQAAYQSVKDLIDRRNAIKNAVVLSNATTPVTVNGVQYTVAEAIDMKSHGMTYSVALLEQMATQMVSAQRNFTQLATSVENKALDLGKTAAGVADADAAKASDVYANYIENNPVKMVDPLDLVNFTQKLADEVDAFNAGVDVALSIVNASTMITIKYGSGPDPDDEVNGEGAAPIAETAEEPTAQ